MIEFSMDIFNSLTSHGWLYEPEARLLWKYAQQTEGNILEVGSYAGRSAALLGHLAKIQDRRVLCVDPWDNTFNDTTPGETILGWFLENTKGLPVEHFRMKVEDWEPRPCGFAYLDGDHTKEGTVRQIEIALKCNPQIIAIDDYAVSGGGLAMLDAAHEVFKRTPDDFVGKLAIYNL